METEPPYKRMAIVDTIQIHSTTQHAQANP